jgi:tetratricopeptide (TPR) repeat protein
MKKRIFAVFIMLMTSMAGYTQSLDQAKIYYNEGRYAEAKPVFEKLVRQSPNNSSYNQWYGVCCYETGDIEAAEKYLLVANKRKVLESCRYLAMLYTNASRFDEAIEMWEGYIELLAKKKEDTTDIELRLEQVRQLQRMQEKTEDVQIIDSIVIDRSAFTEAYSLSSESGKLTPYSAFFKAEAAGDEPFYPNQNDAESTVYINQKGDKIYFARPSANGAFAIYSQNKLLDTWGDEKALFPDNQHDNNYPYVLSDGVTMYFASKGYESLGGYDIFITRYNTASGTFLAPEQMGMPFNSSANDYMMVIDETKGLGWFASDRNQPDDKVCIYLFIPDPDRKRLENISDAALLRRRAALTSISETWRTDADYTPLIQLAHAAEQQDKDALKERDFEFVVNDRTTFYTLDDIKSYETKDLYSEALKINKEIVKLRLRLDEIRSSYTKGNASVREQLRPAILQAENQLYRLMTQSAEQEKKARNAANRAPGIK